MLMDMTSTWLRKKRVWAALAIASCLIVMISHLPLATWLPNARDWIASQGIWAFPTFIAAYIVAAVLGLPNIVLILAAGPLFGLTEGVISASVADTLSIAACFIIGQTIGRRWITGTVRENSRFHKLDRAFAQKGWKIVLLTRLSPVLPSNILNYGFSLTQINFWEYIFFSWLGMLPVIFTYVYVGTFGANMISQQGEHQLFQALGLAATIGVMFYATKLAASALRTEEGETMGPARAMHLGDRTGTHPHKHPSQRNHRSKNAPNWIINSRYLSPKRPQSRPSAAHSAEQSRKRANTQPTPVALPKIIVKR